MTWKYIAGFFDGEGSIISHKSGFRVLIPQTNLDVLERIRAFCNMGFICEVTKRKSHWKDAWIYSIGQQEHVYRFGKNILPYVIVKREKVEKALPEVKRYIQRQRARKELRATRIAKASLFRKQGLSYRKIEVIMGVDRGYLRRILLSKTGS